MASTHRSRHHRQHRARQHHRPRCDGDRGASEMAAAPAATASRLDGSSNTIGGTIAADRNIISGNYLRGVEIGGATRAGRRQLHRHRYHRHRRPGQRPDPGLCGGVRRRGGQHDRRHRRRGRQRHRRQRQHGIGSTRPRRPATWSRATEIGTNAAGTAALPNAVGGILINHRLRPTPSAAPSRPRPTHLRQRPRRHRASHGSDNLVGATTSARPRRHRRPWPTAATASSSIAAASGNTIGGATTAAANV